MNTLAMLILQALPAAPETAWAGKAAFIGTFLLLVVVLVLLPSRLAGDTGRIVPWWRRVRLWAILIALTQIAIYAWWG
jgi:hypothetical protein